uniref:Uncharacterized protein n=1 Tax=Anguilla anguilla TaxID=7936 RepID=A0A0E9SGX0_ANGAN
MSTSWTWRAESSSRCYRAIVTTSTA